MKMTFYKFDGAGNDFVLVDARQHDPHLQGQQIARLCHRRLGIGADGLMTLGLGAVGYDFAMRYYNSDGGEASMCGNGGRCIAVFAHLLGVDGGSGRLRFAVRDGSHEAIIVRWDSTTGKGVVSLGMRGVSKAEVKQVLDGTLLNTGVPHYVQYADDLAHCDLVGEGRRLRHHPLMGPEGANVNLVEAAADGSLNVRTYERGVEDETWSCGTGVTACAIVTGRKHIHTKGGDFEVEYRETATAYEDVRLVGPVSLNFVGEVNL